MTIGGVPDEPVGEGDVVTFTASAPQGLTGPATYAWRVQYAVNARVLATGGGETFDFAVPNNGDFAVEVTATDAAGNTASAIRLFEAFNRPPAIALSGPSFVAEGQRVTFTAAVSTPGGRDDVRVGRWFFYEILPDGTEDLFTGTSGGRYSDVSGDPAAPTLFTRDFTPPRTGNWVLRARAEERYGPDSATEAELYFTVGDPPPAVTVTGVPDGVVAEGTAVTLTAEPPATLAGPVTFAWSLAPRRRGGRRRGGRDVRLHPHRPGPVEPDRHRDRRRRGDRVGGLHAGRVQRPADRRPDRRPGDLRRGHAGGVFRRRHRRRHGRRLHRVLDAGGRGRERRLLPHLGRAAADLGRPGRPPRC